MNKLPTRQFTTKILRAALSEDLSPQDIKAIENTWVAGKNAGERILKHYGVYDTSEQHKIDYRG